jgi:cytochrome c-type biogenesis protein CcmE
MRKKILLSIGILVCIGLAIGIYLYRKPRTTAASQQTDFTITADELYKQFETNETGANAKYTGKILEITGTVGEVQKTDSTLSVLLTAKEAMGGVNCSMATTEVANVQQHKTVTVKGKCAGFLMDVNVLDAVIVSEK